MAKNQDTYDEFGELISESEDRPGKDNKGPADLRKANKRLKKERDEMAKTLAELKQESHSRSIKDVLESKGVPPKVAKFIPTDVITPDQIDAWLTENSDVFGIQITTDSGQAANLNKENASKFERLNNATQNASSPTKDTDLLAKLNDPNLTKEALEALRNGGPKSGRRNF